MKDSYLIESVNHLKKKLDKGVSFEKTMHILYKLQKIPVTLKLLRKTEIGVKLRELSMQQKDNDVGKMAKLLIFNWKQILENQENDDDDENETKESDSESIDSTHQNELDSDLNKSEEADESLQDNYSEKYSSNISHKGKKHKKKKKKSKENHSDDEDHGSSKSKKKKKHRRDEDIEKVSYHRSHKHNKHESPRKDYAENKTHKYEDSCSQNIQQHEMKLNGESSCSNSFLKNEPSTSKRKIIDDDMFSTVLGMGDSAVKTKNLAKISSTNVKNKNNPRILQFDKPEPVFKSMTQQNNLNIDVVNALQKYQSSSSRNFDTYNLSSYRTPQKSQSDKNLIGMKFKGRTQVFSGSSKVSTVPEVYSLLEICIRVLMQHLDKIYEVGDLPYHILKPVLEKCPVKHLKRIEYYNPQLLDETDELWKRFCREDHKITKLDENIDTWRDFYNLLVQQREDKLKSITESINSKHQKAAPKQRITKQIEMKPSILPREIRRKQEKSTNLEQFTPLGRGSKILPINNKPKTAPLMKKLLQIRQSKFRR